VFTVVNKKISLIKRSAEFPAAPYQGEFKNQKACENFFSVNYLRKGSMIAPAIIKPAVARTAILVHIFFSGFL
jgi:hypothetical protein